MLSKKFVYLIKDEFTSYYKIGVSNNPHKRILNLQTGNSFKLTLISYFETDYAFKLEKAFHNFNIYCKVNNEWFDLPNDVVENFINLCQKYENNFKTINKDFTM
jgi:hypothetical protein